MVPCMPSDNGMKLESNNTIKNKSYSNTSRVNNSTAWMISKNT